MANQEKISQDKTPKNFREDREPFFNPEGITEVHVLRNSREEAISLIKEFWKIMDPRTIGGEYGLQMQNSYPDYYLNELTYGNRTTPFEENGKWKIVFNGNGLRLSTKALDWLKNKGLVHTESVRYEVKL